MLASGFGGHSKVPSCLGRLGCADAQRVVSNLVWPSEDWRAVRMSGPHSLFFCLRCLLRRSHRERMAKRLLPALVQVSKGHFFLSCLQSAEEASLFHPFLSFSGLKEEQKLLKKKG